MGFMDDDEGAQRRAEGERFGNIRGEVVRSEESARLAREEARQRGLGAIAGGFAGGRRETLAGRDAARGALYGSYGEAQNALGQGRSDMMAGYGQGQGAIGAGLQGGLGSIAGGNAAAQGMLNPYIQQDQAARGQYQQRLMGGLAGGDDPYWNRLSGQRTDNIEASLAKQGMLGSSAGGQALADSGAQLQGQREQQFFDRAQGLFNNSAGQAAGFSQQAGMAGADLYGRAGQASAGLYGQQAEGMAGMGRAGAGLFQDRGRDVASAEGDFSSRLAGMETGLGGAQADLWGAYGSGRAGDMMGGAGIVGGQSYHQQPSGPGVGERLFNAGVGIAANYAGGRAARGGW